MTSPKVLNGSLLGEDFKAGQLPQGPQGPQGEGGPQGQQGMPGTARAYGLVAANGTVGRSKNVIGNATASGGGPPVDGHFCLTLDPSIDAAQAVVVAETDFTGDITNSIAKTLTFAKGSSAGCGNGQIAVRTGVFDGDEIDDQSPDGTSPGDDLDYVNQPFFFVVP